MHSDLSDSELPLPSELPPVDPPPLIPSPPSTPSPAVWGPGITLAMGLGVAGAFVAVQSVVAVGFVIAYAAQGRRADLGVLQNDGLLVSVALCATSPVVVGLSALFAWLKRGLPVKEYLGLKPVGWKVCLLSVLGLLPVYALWLAATKMFDIPEVPQFMLDVYGSAGWLPLLWFAVVIAAPVSEELFFRGFLFQGLVRSRLGVTGTILLTSLFWAGIHMQYGLSEIMCIFVLGLLLGFVRFKSDSVWPALLVHAVSNLISTVQMAFLQR